MLMTILRRKQVNGAFGLVWFWTLLLTVAATGPTALEPAASSAGRVVVCIFVFSLLSNLLAFLRLPEVISAETKDRRW